MIPRNVLLVNPRICSRRSMRLPLSLLALGAALEGSYEYRIVDGNADSDPLGLALETLADAPHAAVGMSVMPGPQVGPAIELSRAIRAAHPTVPIVWGGYFPTLYPDAAINAPYVDYVVRGQGEETLLELLDRLPGAGPPSTTGSARDAGAIGPIRGLTWKEGGRTVHNAERPFRTPDSFPPYPYERLGDVGRYLRPSFMGSRTGVHQAAVGCRYRCTFCGVASMFNGLTRLQGPVRLEHALTVLCDRYGVNAMQYYDHNFFDREESSVPILEVLAKFALPWWCYARADTLAGFSAGTWELVRRSRLRMAYIGAEAASDAVLKGMRKGTRVEQTLEVARRCRENGVIPEFSFVLGGPEEPEEEIDRTFRFIKRVKKAHPECEIVLHFHSLVPQRAQGGAVPVLETYGPGGPPLPNTPEGWAEPRWVDYVCHQDAPWLSPQVRRRVRDFIRVLYSRYPTVQDYHTPRIGKWLLKAASGWRYATGRYDNPWELERLKRLIPLREPQKESL